MILREDYRDELVEAIDDLPIAVFVHYGLDKHGIINDNDSIDRMWGIYQKDIEDYDCDADWSVKDALHEVCGVPHEAWMSRDIAGDAAEIYCENVNSTIPISARDAAEKVLVDNGIDEDEVSTVLQAIGYTLLDVELYPEEV